jgi:hypothetical protein
VTASREALAHQLAAGFLEKASLYAAKHGSEKLLEAMDEALASLSEEFRLDRGESPAPREECEAVLLACQIARSTLAADRRTVN